MRLMSTIGFVAGALSCSGLVHAGVTGDEAAQLRALQEEVAQLRRSNAELHNLKMEVAQLKAGQEEDWLNEQREMQIRGLIEDVLADADSRASLLDDGLTAGHNGKHFFLRSPGGLFLMEIDGRIQVRYVANFRENTGFEDGGEEANPVDDFKSGFEIRRAKIAFSGHVASPKIGYEIQIEVDREDNTVEADKIVIDYKLTDAVTLWVGEDKAPFMREELTSSKRQLAVERSVFNEQFTVDKVQGFGVIADVGEAVQIHGMIHDGFKSGSGSTDIFFTQEEDFNEEEGDDRDTSKRFFEDAVDIALTGRIDVKIAGSWKQMKDFTAWSGEDLAAFFGAALHYEIGETGDGFNNNNFWAWTVDGSIEVAGVNVFAAIAGQHSDFDQVVSADEFDRIGFLIQGGYNIPLGDGSLEPFGRFEWMDFDGTNGTNGVGRDDILRIFTFGANYYFDKHNAKLTVDVMIAFDNVRDRHTGLGVLRDAPGEDGQVVVRSQFQLLF